MRHTFYTWRRLRTLHDTDETFEEHRHADACASVLETRSRLAETPERAMLLQADLNLLNQCRNNVAASVTAGSDCVAGV